MRGGRVPQYRHTRTGRPTRAPATFASGRAGPDGATLGGVRGERPGGRRTIARAAGALLLAGAAVAFTLTVRVHAAAPPGRPAAAASCGSAWDLVAGRSGWQRWWVLDQADPVAGAPRLRTDRCVDAVNAQLARSALLAAAAVAAFAVAALAGTRARPRARAGSPVRRLRAFGTTLSVLGWLLSVAGVVGLALLVADADAPLFLYVSRSVVMLLGMLLLLPAVLLVALGRGARLLAEGLAEDASAAAADRPGVPPEPPEPRGPPRPEPERRP